MVGDAGEKQMEGVSTRRDVDPSAQRGRRLRVWLWGDQAEVLALGRISDF